MLVIPRKDFPKDLNPLGLKRGDTIQIEIADATTDFITLDPATLKLAAMRDANEPREPLVKVKKPTLTNLPLPDFKTMLQRPVPASKPNLPPTDVGSVRG